MSQVSLKDVAAAANVSFQTVSKVLNGKGSVAPKTRSRILDAAESLGYVPNALARSLHGTSTHTIGVISTDFSRPEVALNIVGIEHEARRRDIAVLIGSLDPDGTDCERYLRVMLERRVDGVIMNAPPTEHDTRVGELLRDSFTAVSLHEVAGGGVPVVRPSAQDSGLLPTRHLVQLGHTRIATITGQAGRRITKHRTEGYRRALEQRGITFDETIVEPGDWTVEGGYGATHRLLDRAVDVTAIYVQNDRMAIGALSALHDRGLSVPEDCSVVGCDGVAESARTIPPLTTVHIPFHETGETATRLLLDIVAGQAKPRSITLPVSMVYRSSTASPRTR